MEKFCVKGYLKRSGKRVLSILLCACMIGTMIPITARAETEGTSMPSNGEVTCTCANLCTEDKVNSDCLVCGAEEADLSKCTGMVQSENNENQLNTGESEEAKNETELTITGWEWIDEEELINPETGILALPFANEETPAFFDDVIALLPTQIQATVVNEEDIEAEAASETITLGDWSCEEYPKEGAYSESYTFATTLPEGYVLSEEAKALNVLVELGGAQMYESAESVIVGDFTVTGGTKGTDYEYVAGEEWEGGVLTIKTETPVTIKNTEPNTPTTDRIEVAKGNCANITLAGVNINVSDMGETAAFKIADNSTGNVTITLADDSVNTLKSGSNCAGLQKNGGEDTGTLIIQGGTNGTGKLTAIGGSGGYGAAGIGGGGSCGSGSNITISGGTVTANGKGEGAGIGGGSHGYGSNITISGGTVTATGFEGAAIGGGLGGTGSNITISGGTVSATGTTGGAGIGGGNVTATSEYGAGIGGGNGGEGSNITISGGNVTATSEYGAGIGGGNGGEGSNITISGGTVTATGSNRGAGIGGGNGGEGSNITISGGSVTATGGFGGGAGIGGGGNGDGYNITISGGSVKAVADSNAIGGGAGRSAVTPTSNGTTPVYLLTIANTDSKEVLIDGVSYTLVNHKSVDGNDTNLYAYLTGEPHLVKVGEKLCYYVFDSDSKAFIAIPFIINSTNGGALTYGTDYTYENNVLTIKSTTPVTIANVDPNTAITTDRIEVADGVSANITLAGVNISSAGYPAFKIGDNSTGNVIITLADGSENKLKGGTYSAGLQKNGNVAGIGKLTIQGGTEGTGKLEATGSRSGGAGIGGYENRPCSNITISGGTVTATGGECAAGIGGGKGASGSNITISGGTVTANGGHSGAGIGGSYTGSGSDITISGGTVTANGGKYATGIGGGSSGSGSDITISGGTVTANGGSSGAGIGGGATGDGSNIIISGGSVNAVAGTDANAIGGGADRDAVTPTSDGTTPVYPITIENPDSKEVLIDGVSYTPVNHKAVDGNDGNLYAYLTGEPHLVMVGEKTWLYMFNSGSNTFTAMPLTLTLYPTNGGRLTYNTDYTYADGVLTIKSDTPITIANTDPNTVTTDRIEVAENVLAEITLAGVNIDVSSKSDTAAFKIAYGSFGSVTITLADDSVNKLKSGSNCAGLQMIRNLYIKGEGELIATGGDNGAGIGGGYQGEVSNIRIMGGTVIATGGSNGAGIGGKQSGFRSDITISGGTVTATGGSNGAGIGGGDGSYGSSILITGGTVTATGSGGGAGIGGGNLEVGRVIIIKGGTVTATGGSGGGAGIGGGNNYIGTGITINGGTVTATGSGGGAGIGGGNAGYGSNIEISGGTVTATGSGRGAGIGGGKGGSGSNINISGGTVTATGGSNGGAGIGVVGDSGSGITMEGDAVLYTSSINGDYSFNKGVVYDGVTVSGDAGSYTLAGGVGTVYGNPNVSGFTKPEGSILGTYLADTEITVTVPDVDYTGEEAVITATVTVDKIALGGTKTLVQGTDYTVSVSSEDKTNAGAKTATITAMTGSGNVGETTKAFNVNTVDLSADKIKMTLSEIPEAGYVYDNAAKEPVPVVTLKRADGSEYTLTKDTDYTVSYSHNTDAYGLLSGDEGYDADKAPTVKITAVANGNFTGSRSMNFKILLADMPGFTITPYSGSYDGANHEVVSITPAEGFTDYAVYYSTDNKVTWSTTVPTITDAGTLDFYVKVTKANYKDWISEKQTAKVTPVALDSSMISFTDENHYYTGQEVKPEITVKDSNRTLVSGKDYTVSYTNNTSVSAEDSKAKATITAANGNYTGSASAEFNIEYANKEYMDYCTVSGMEGKDGWYSSDVTIQNKAETEQNNAWGALQFSGSPTGAFADSYTVSAEGETNVTIWFKQTTTGYIGSDATTVKIDKTAPTWTENGCGISVKENWWKKLANTISFGLFYKEATVDVEVCAKDNLSGIDAYYYYVDATGSTTVLSSDVLDTKTFTKVDGSGAQTLISLDSENKYVVYAYAIDNAGNRSDYVCTNGVVLDRTAPTIGVITTPSKEELTLTDTSAKISFTGSEAGTCFYMISEVAPDSIDGFATSSENSQGMTVWTAKEGVSSVEMTTEAKQITLSSLSPNTTYTLYLAAVDKAGNSSIVYSQTFTTCKTMPTITTNPSISGTYGQKVEDMTLTDGVAKVGSDVITGTWAVTDSNKTNVPAVGTTDTYQVIFTPADTYGDIYDTVIVTVKPTVSKRAITVAADDKTKTYGQDNPELTYTVPEGKLIGNDTKDALGVTLSCVATITSPVKEGGYAITGTSNSANYDVTVTPGTLTINKADAAITVDTGKDSYSKTFGDAAFTLSGISDTNTDANVQYAVTLGEDVVSVSNGTVTILKAGTATITVSLPASTNYNAAASKTITVTVAKKSGYTVDEINRRYYYLRDNADTIDLSGYLPSNCGTVSYGTPQVNGELYTDGGQPIVSADGKLSYTVKQAETYGTTGTIQVTVTTDNYESFTITVNVKLTDKLQVNLKSGSSVTLQNSTLTYGQTLSTLAFNSAVFVDDGGNVVTGTLAWKTPDEKPNAGTTRATWVFTPDDEAYATVEDTVAITVKKATPNVTALPTVAARTYHPTASLTNADLTGGTVNVEGSWSWQSANIIPVVSNSGYVAVFTPTDSTNYETVTKTITVSVTKATPCIATAPTAAAITYGDTLGASALTGDTVQYSGSDTTTVAGSFAWKDSRVKPSVSDSGTTAYRVVFNPSDTVNYNTAETDITLTVNKADNAPNMPSSTMNVANSCTKVSDVTIPTDWVWQDADKNTALVVDTPVTATAVYNGADKGNYENETVSVTITRSACDHAHTEVRNAKEETCSEAGYTGDTYCTDCGAKTKTGTATPALGHNYTSNVTKEPTTSSEGVMTYTCDRCGHSYTRAIAKLQDTNNNSPSETQSSQPGNTKPGSKPATDTGETTEAPFIRGENGKEGWDVIKDEVDKTKDGDTVTVEMNGTSVVLGDVLDDIKGKDVTIVFDMGGGITWSVNGQSITGDTIGDIDFTVTTNTNTIPVDIINNVTGERTGMQISLAYDGEFGFTAVLSINMEAENAGLFANLFYYNEKTGEMEFICYDEIAADGTADLTFTHASDYAIVIDTEPMDSVSDGEVLNGETDSDEEISTIENDKKDTQDVTEADSKTWNPWWVIIICIVVIVIGLGAFIVIRKRNQKI